MAIPQPRKLESTKYTCALPMQSSGLAWRCLLQLEEATFVLHYVNVFEEGDKVIIDAVHYPEYPLNNRREELDIDAMDRVACPTCVTPLAFPALYFCLDGRERFVTRMAKSKRKH